MHGQLRQRRQFHERQQQLRPLRKLLLDRTKLHRWVLSEDYALPPGRPNLPLEQILSLAKASRDLRGYGLLRHYRFHRLDDLLLIRQNVLFQRFAVRD